MSDEFTQHIFRIIIAKAAQNLGFSTISETALNILVDVAISKVQDYAKSAAAMTTHCGRTDTNGYDIFYALFRHENPKTLTDFLNGPSCIQPFEFLVERYPIPAHIKSNFYYRQLQEYSKSQPSEPIPFRCNMPIIPKEEKSKISHIPNFLPSFPQEYTYKTDQTPVDASFDEQAVEKQRSDDQKQLQEAINRISSNRDSDGAHTPIMKPSLVSLMSNDLATRPTPLLESPAYVMDGIRPTYDPENLPLLNITEGDVEGDLNREQRNNIRILQVVHGETSLGKSTDAANVNDNAMTD